MFSNCVQGLGKWTAWKPRGSVPLRLWRAQRDYRILLLFSWNSLELKCFITNSVLGREKVDRDNLCEWWMTQVGFEPTTSDLYVNALPTELPAQLTLLLKKISNFSLMKAKVKRATSWFWSMCTHCPSFLRQLLRKRLCTRFFIRILGSDFQLTRFMFLRCFFINSLPPSFSKTCLKRFSEYGLYVGELLLR